MKHFKELNAQTNLQNGLIDPAQDLKMLPFWIIADVIYGELSRDFERTLSELAPLREAVFRNVISGGLSRFSWSQYLPTEANRDLHKFKAKWSKFNQDARDRALRLGTRPPVVDLFDAIAAGQITQEHLLHTMDEVLYANLDVTLGGISWNLVFLAAYPECQQRIRDEVAEWRRNPKGGGFDSYFMDDYISISMYSRSLTTTPTRRLLRPPSNPNRPRHRRILFPPRNQLHRRRLRPKPAKRLLGQRDNDL